MKKFLSYLILSCILCTALCAEEAGISLTVKASVKDAVVTVNSRKCGQAPVTLSDLKPGFYIVTVEKEGWYSWKNEIALNDGDDITLFAEMEKITGTVVLNCPQGTPDIYIDGTLYDSSDSDEAGFLDLLESLIYKDMTVLKVPEGMHTITLRQFGYEEWKTSVVVLRKTTQKLDVTMTRTPFTATGFSSKIPRFNPANPGGLGSVSIHFSVSARGYAEVEIINPWGEILETKYIGPFTSWSNSFTWDGASPFWGADFLEDGYYTIRFNFESEPNETYPLITQTVETYVEIDSSLTYTVASFGEAGLSTGAVPMALMSPANSLFLDTAAGALLRGAEDTVPLVPISLGFEYTITPQFSFALSGKLLADFSTNNVTTGAFTGAVRYQLLDGPLSAAMAARYQYVYGESGICLFDRSAGIAADITAGGLLTRSLYAGISGGVLYGDDHGLFADPALRIRGGIGLNLTLGSFAADLYALVFANPAQSLTTADGIEAGAGIHYVPKSSPILLNISGNMYFRPDEAMQASITAGFSFLN